MTEMTHSPSTLDLSPVVKVRVLPCPPETVFALFTEQMGAWWPVTPHSVAGDRVASVTVEPRVGGHVYETDTAGVRSDWATVTAYDAPRRLALDWYAGRTPDRATRVEVTFTASGPDPTTGAGTGTTLRLVHDGWPAGDAARRDDYEGGWDVVLAPLVTLATASPG